MYVCENGRDKNFAYVNDVLENKLQSAFSLAQLEEIRERSNQNIIT